MYSDTEATLDVLETEFAVLPKQGDVVVIPPHAQTRGGTCVISDRAPAGSGEVTPPSSRELLVVGIAPQNDPNDTRECEVLECTAPLAGLLGSHRWGTTWRGRNMDRDFSAMAAYGTDCNLSMSC